mgnify:CR=1 FL=1|jgi:hypothetical protein
MPFGGTLHGILAHARIRHLPNQSHNQQVLIRSGYSVHDDKEAAPGFLDARTVWIRVGRAKEEVLLMDIAALGLIPYTHALLRAAGLA